MLIIILFAVGLSPIALLLLLLKLFGKDRPKQNRYQPPAATNTSTASKTGKAGSAVRSVTKSPKSKKSTYIALIIGGTLLALGCLGLVWDSIDMMIWLGEIESYYVEDVISGLMAAVGGVAMIFCGVSISRAMIRYSQYMEVIGPQTCISSVAVSKALGYSQRQVEKDFMKMIENDYFGDGAYYNVELEHLFIDSIAEVAWRAREEANRPPEPEVENTYTAVLRALRKANDDIEDAALSEKIERLENVTAKIFRAYRK